MANTVIGASVEVEFESIGQVRKAIKDATSDLLRMQEAFGKTSPQAIDAAKRVADLRDRINDAKEQADLFDPGNKFKAFSNAASQVAAGFSAVQGAMALAGSESEDLQKTLVRVQGAMALSQGLSQIADLGKAYEELKIVAVNAFKSIRAAIGATGIGLLVIALGTIVAYWDDIKAAVSGVSEEQKKLNKESQKNLDAQKEKLDAISGQENILKLQGKSEKDILKLKLAQTDETIKAAEVNLKNNIETKKAQVAAAKRNKEILQGLIAFVSLPITAVLKGIDLIGQAVGKNFDLYGKFSGGLASLVFDPEKTEKEGAEDIKAQKKALDDLKNQRAGYELSLKEIDKKANDERKAAAQKSADELKKIRDAAIEAERKAREDLTRSNLSERDKELFDLKNKYEQEKAVIEAGGRDASALTELYKKNQADINKKYDDEEKKRIEELEEKKKQKELEEAERLKKAHENTLQMVKEQNQALVNAEIELQNQRFNAASAGLDLLQSLAGENEKLANAIFAVQKGLEIARIITDTARGIVAAKAGLAAVPPFLGTIPNPAFVLAAASAAKQIAGLKIAAGVSIAQIASASVQKFKRGAASTPGGGGGLTPPPSIVAPLTPAPSAAVQGQALNAQAINNLGNTATRAYVLNSDIQNNDQRNAYLQRNARIG